MTPATVVRAAPATGALLLLVLSTAACRTEHLLGEVRIATDAAPGAPARAPCEPFAPGTNLNVCTATYLSGRGAETTAAVDIASDGNLIVGANIEGADLGAAPRELVRGTAGAVVRVLPDVREVLSLLRLGDQVIDLEVDPSRGTIVVLGVPFGVAALEPDGARLLWPPQAVAGTRVAVGSDGTIAVLDSERGQVSVLDWLGKPRGVFPLAPADGAADIAVHGGSKTIIVTGSQTAGTTTRQPFLHGYEYDGRVRWKNYGWSWDEVNARKLQASTKGVRVAIGRDDKLYYAGESHGGNTTHSYDPRDLAVKAGNKSFDAYTNPYDIGPSFVLYIARFGPGDGAHQGGQMYITRKGMGQSMHPLAVAADERGNVIVGGTQNCCMADQDKRTVRGMKVGSADPDAFVLVVPADFSRRLLWTTFSAGGKASTAAVVMARGVAAAVALQDQAESARAPLITYEPMQATPGGGASDAFLAVWSAP